MGGIGISSSCVHRDHGAHPVLFSRTECDSIAQDVAGLDAEHLLPFFVCKVRKLRSALLTRVPNYGGAGVEFLGTDTAREGGVEDVDGSLCVDVGVVDGPIDAQVGRLSFLAVGIGVVEVGYAVETADADLLNGSDAKVGMQGFFKAQRPGAAIDDAELKAEGIGKADAVGEQEFMGPPGARRIIAGGEADGGDRSIFFCAEGIEPPLAGADEAVLGSFGIISLVAEPGEADRDAATNRLAMLEAGVPAEEEHFRGAGRRPTQHLGAIKGELRGCCRAVDAHGGQTAVAGDDLGNTVDAEAAVQCVDSGNGFHPERILPDWGKSGQSGYNDRIASGHPKGKSVPGESLILIVSPPILPMLAKRVDSIPASGEWLFEPKWDGFRVLVFRDGDEVLLQSRDEKPLNRYFPELPEAVRAQLPHRCVLDGEIVIAREERLDFDALQLRIHPAASRIKLLAQETPASIVFFDLLSEGERDLREMPFAERRAELEKLLRKAKPPLYLTPATRDRDVALDWFKRFEGAGFDGVVAKPLQGRTSRTSG